jgi:two-component system, sensor histidine kinase and response regulator
VKWQAGIDGYITKPIG